MEFSGYLSTMVKQPTPVKQVIIPVAMTAPLKLIN